MKFRSVVLLFLMFVNISCISGNRGACSPHGETFDESQVEITLREPSKKRGLIVIMPPTGGSNFLDRQYAGSLCNDGFKTIIVENWPGLEEKSLSLQVHKRLLDRAQNAIDEVLNKASSSYIGIFGTSVGALHGAVALGRRSDISSGFFIAGGGPIHKVIATSNESTLENYREQRLKKFSFKSVDAYAEAINKVVPAKFDALSYKSSIQKKPLALIIANSDKTVLTEYQKNWVEAFNPKTVYEFDSGHFWSIVKSWWFHENKVSEFFLNQVEPG